MSSILLFLNPNIGISILSNIIATVSLADIWHSSHDVLRMPAPHPRLPGFQSWL